MFDFLNFFIDGFVDDVVIVLFGLMDVLFL